MRVRDLQKELQNYDPEDDFIFEQGKMIIVTKSRPYVFYDCHLHKPILASRFDTTLEISLNDIKQQLLNVTCHPL